MDYQSPEGTAKNQRPNLQIDAPYILWPIKKIYIYIQVYAVLQQEGKPMAFASKALTETE